MTPEERAGFIVAPYVAIVDAPAALGELIAEHIRQAVAEEREVLAEIVRMLMESGTPVDGVVQAIRSHSDDA